MEVDSQYVTLLTREGEFLKAKNQQKQYEIGEEIDFFPIEEFPIHEGHSFFRLNKWRIAVASSLAILLVFLSFIPYYMDNRVYAYMTIDVNPSIELGVNHDLEVISVEALNQEGKEIVTHLDDWKKKNVEHVTKTIIQECKQDGYLTEGKTVLIATVMNKKSDETKQHLEQKMEKLTSRYQEKEIKIETISAKKEERQKAKTQGISTGQLLKVEHKLDKKSDEKFKSKNENKSMQKHDHKQKDNRQPKQNEHNKKAPSSNKQQKEYKQNHPQHHDGHKNAKKRDKQQERKQKKEHPNHGNGKNKDHKGHQNKHQDEKGHQSWSKDQHQQKAHP